MAAGSTDSHRGFRGRSHQPSLAVSGELHSHHWQDARPRPARQAGGDRTQAEKQNPPRGGSSAQISTMDEIMAQLPSPDNRGGSNRPLLAASASRLFISRQLWDHQAKLME